MVDNWQTIETAPKDSTPVELFSPYDRDLNCKGGLIWISGGWRDTGGWRGDQVIEPPTHWTPLRSSPLDELASGEMVAAPAFAQQIDLLEIAERIERLTAWMPSPNSHRAGFIQLAIAIRQTAMRAARDADDG